MSVSRAPAPRSADPRLGPQRPGITGVRRDAGGAAPDRRALHGLRSLQARDPDSVRRGRSPRLDHASRRAARSRRGPGGTSVRRPGRPFAGQGPDTGEPRSRGTLSDERGQALQVEACRGWQAPHPRTASSERGERVPPVASAGIRDRAAARRRVPRGDGGARRPRPSGDDRGKPRSRPERRPAGSRRSSRFIPQRCCAHPTTPLAAR